MPDVVVGSYIKVNLIGKPVRQVIDKKFYIALRYVGVKGMLLQDIKDENLKNVIDPPKKVYQ